MGEGNVMEKQPVQLDPQDLGLILEDIFKELHHHEKALAVVAHLREENDNNLYKRIEVLEKLVQEMKK